ncbi:MAG: hypothetical protein M3Y55_12495, partial [Pseudomonadota bacterium]|nr:hypothetical protein [Pseudomonadota bacterium]
MLLGGLSRRRHLRSPWRDEIAEALKPLPLSFRQRSQTRVLMPRRPKAVSPKALNHYTLESVKKKRQRSGHRLDSPQA